MENVITEHNSITKYITRMTRLMDKMEIPKVYNQTQVRELLITDNYKNMYPVETIELLYVLNELNARYLRMCTVLHPDQ